MRFEPRALRGAFRVTSIFLDVPVVPEVNRIRTGSSALLGKRNPAVSSGPARIRSTHSSVISCRCLELEIWKFGSTKMRSTLAGKLDPSHMHGFGELPQVSIELRVGDRAPTVDERDGLWPLGRMERDVIRRHA